MLEGQTREGENQVQPRTACRLTLRLNKVEILPTPGAGKSSLAASRSLPLSVWQPSRSLPSICSNAALYRYFSALAPSFSSSTLTALLSCGMVCWCALLQGGMFFIYRREQVGYRIIWRSLPNGLYIAKYFTTKFSVFGMRHDESPIGCTGSDVHF